MKDDKNIMIKQDVFSLQLGILISKFIGELSNVQIIGALELAKATFIEDKMMTVREDMKRTGDYNG